MASNGGVVLVVGDGVAADRARARLEEAGQQVLRAPWSRSHFTEVEKGPGPVAVGDCDVLIAFPPAADSESRWPGLLDRVRSRGVVVLAGSMPPRDVAALADVVAARGLAFLDAPTAADGGVIPVGATEAELEGARPLLETLGTPILQGAAGTGQQARLCGEIALGATMIGLCEALAYARAAGLEPQRVLEVLPGLGERGGVALAQRTQRVLRGEPGDSESVAGLVADAEAILGEAESIELDLPGLELTRVLYAAIADMGLAEAGVESLVALWQDDDEAGPSDLVQLGRR